MSRRVLLTICVLLTLCAMSGCLSLKEVRDTVRKVATGIQPYQIVQAYTVWATKDRTEISATVHFTKMEDASVLVAYPDEVFFNGVKMSHGAGKLLDETDYDSPCPVEPVKEDKKAGRFVIAPTGRPTPKESKRSEFNLKVDGYKTENEIAFDNYRKQPVSFKLVFEPVEFEAEGILNLSRSKDNAIRLKGKPGEIEDALEFYFEHDYFDNEKKKLISYDPSKNVLMVSPDALKPYKVNQKVGLFLVSSDRKYIKVPDATDVSHFNITYKDKRCIQVVD